MHFSTESPAAQYLLACLALRLLPACKAGLGGEQDSQWNLHPRPQLSSQRLSLRPATRHVCVTVWGIATERLVGRRMHALSSSLAQTACSCVVDFLAYVGGRVDMDCTGASRAENQKSVHARARTVFVADRPLLTQNPTSSQFSDLQAKLKPASLLNSVAAASCPEP